MKTRRHLNNLYWSVEVHSCMCIFSWQLMINLAFEYRCFAGVKSSTLVYINTCRSLFTQVSAVKGLYANSCHRNIESIKVLSLQKKNRIGIQWGLFSFVIHAKIAHCFKKLFQEARSPFTPRFAPVFVVWERRFLCAAVWRISKALCHAGHDLWV